MPMASCEPAKILVPGGFSKANSILASFSRSPSGQVRLPQFNGAPAGAGGHAAAFVEFNRSAQRKWSAPAPRRIWKQTADPASRPPDPDDKESGIPCAGSSSNAPAGWPCGRRFGTRYWIPSAGTARPWPGVLPSSLTTKISGATRSNSATKSMMPEPLLMKHAFTCLKASSIYCRSDCGVDRGAAFQFLTVWSEPMAT